MYKKIIFNNIKFTIGQKISSRRKQLKLTQGQVATAMNLSRQQIIKYENGIDNVSLEKLSQLADILGVFPEYFLDGLPMFFNSIPCEKHEHCLYLLKCFLRLPSKKHQNFIINQIEFFIN